MCLRGGRWWDPWPAQAPERRGNGQPGGVNVQKPLGAPCGTHDAGKRLGQVRTGPEGTTRAGICTQICRPCGSRAKAGEISLHGLLKDCEGQNATRDLDEKAVIMGRMAEPGLGMARADRKEHHSFPVTAIRAFTTGRSFITAV